MRFMRNATSRDNTGPYPIPVKMHVFSAGPSRKNSVSAEGRTPNEIPPPGFHTYFSFTPPPYACPFYSQADHPPSLTSRKVFNNNSRIVAIKRSGNVFAAEAVEELNFKAKSWNDLLTGEEFTKKVRRRAMVDLVPFFFEFAQWVKPMGAALGLIAFQGLAGRTWTKI